MAVRELALAALADASGGPLDVSDSIFTGEGFVAPWRPSARDAVPWSAVHAALSMARDALLAKQAAAEELQREVEDARRGSFPGDAQLLERVRRAPPAAALAAVLLLLCSTAQRCI
jgi:hypothetical protein